MIYLNLYDANAGFSPDPKDTDRFKEFLSQKYERKRSDGNFDRNLKTMLNSVSLLEVGMLNQPKL